MDREPFVPRPLAAANFRPRSYSGVWVLLIGFAGALFLLNLWFYDRQRSQTLSRIEESLSGLADLKAKELEDHLAALAHNSVVMTRDEPAIDIIGRAQAAGRRPTAVERQQLLTRLNAWYRDEQFVGVELLDARLRRLGLVGVPMLSATDLASLRARVDSSGRPALSEAHRERALGDSVALCVLTPLRVGRRRAGGAVAYALFTVNASRDILPRLYWGIRRRRAEVSLVRQVGDQVEYLSEYSLGAAPAGHRHPLDHSQLAAAYALRGELTGTDALDYRGERVVYAAHRVEGTSWVLITKVDRADAMKVLRDSELMALVLVLLIGAFTGVLTYLVLRRVRAEARADEADAKLQLELARQKYDLLSRSAQDGILVADEEGLIVDASERCEVLYGMPRLEIVGKKLIDLRSERARPSFREQIARAQEAGAIYETEHRRADGTLFPVEVSARLIALGERRFHHAIVRDISTRVTAEAEARLQREILSHLEYGVALVRAGDGTFVYANPSFERLFGYGPGELDGQPLSTINAPTRLAPEETAAEISAEIAATGGFDGDVLNIRKDASLVWTHAAITTFEHPTHGELFVVHQRDVTQVREVQRRQELAASIFGSSSEAMMITDADSRILEVNPAFTDITGYRALEAIGKTPRLLASGKHSPDFYRRMWQELLVTGRWEGEIWNRRQDGEIFAEWLMIVAVRDSRGEVENYIAQFSDISEKKRASEVVWKQANYDTLTDLPNRRLFRDRLEQELKKARRANLSVALLFIDLDRFKEVNDTLGHLAGDRILVEVAERIVRTVRDSDTVARLGGDEFTVIVSDLTDPARVERIAANLVHALDRPYDLEGERIQLSASIGVSIHPRDGTDVDTLLQNADQAMYRAKRGGQGRFSLFTKSMHETSQRRHRLARDIHDALAASEFVLHFQPVVDLRTGTIMRAEALIRWNHPILGLIPPGEFIPVAEETGLIAGIGDWVIREALRTGERFAGLLGQPFRVSVNMSKVQLLHRVWRRSWLDAMRRDGANGQRLVIEITEGSLLSGRAEVRETLAAYRAAGVEIALDDFGTGYSSLSQLNQGSIDLLKLDESCIGKVAAGNGDLAFTEGIIVMAHKLGMRVIAEGVETSQQRDLLVAAGCDLAQGYLFSRPLTEAHFERLIIGGVAIPL